MLPLEIVDWGTQITFQPPVELATEKSDPIVDIIKSYSRLDEGWDFGVGGKIEELVIKKALDIYSLGKLENLKVEALPTSEGGITLIFSEVDKFLDVTINSNTSLDARVEEGIGQEYTVLSEEEGVSKWSVLKLMAQIKRVDTEWCWSGPYSDLNIAKANKDFSPKYLNQAKEEYPYSMMPALV